jgi:hypothetical protein
LISEVKHSSERHISDFENQKSRIVILYSIPDQDAIFSGSAFPQVGFIETLPQVKSGIQHPLSEAVAMCTGEIVCGWQQP